MRTVHIFAAGARPSSAKPGAERISSIDLENEAASQLEVEIPPGPAAMEPAAVEKDLSFE